MPQATPAQVTAFETDPAVAELLKERVAARKEFDKEWTANWQSMAAHRAHMALINVVNRLQIKAAAHNLILEDGILFQATN